MSVRKAVQDVTDRIAARSGDTRRDYLNRLDAAKLKASIARR
jgi:phosphogluconate dehydratase